MIEYYKTQFLIDQLVNDNIVPGVSYAVIKNKQIISSINGFAGILPHYSDLNPFSVYDLASLTKVIGTTNVFLQLFENGKLNFNEPVGDFIPGFTDRKVRISHLLTHTSGIKGWIANRDTLSANELLQAIIHLPVTNELDNKMVYADTNFILLGLILEKIYKKPVQEIIYKKVILPTKLKPISFHPNYKNSVPTALLNNGKVLQGIVHDPKARILGEHCGSAGLFSDLESLIKLSKGYLGLDEKILPITQETLASLFTIKTSSNVHPRSWGWDLCFDPEDKHPILFHTGFTGTFMILDRYNKSGLIVLTNRIHPSGHNQIFLAMRQRIIDTFLQENIQNK